jgi:hypothetical protein
MEPKGSLPYSQELSTCPYAEPEQSSQYLHDGRANTAKTSQIALQYWVVFQMLHLEKWIVCTPLSVNVFLTLATQEHLEYHYKALFETPYITNGSQIEP